MGFTPYIKKELQLTIRGQNQAGTRHSHWFFLSLALNWTTLPPL